MSPSEAIRTFGSDRIKSTTNLKEMVVPNTLSSNFYDALFKAEGEVLSWCNNQRKNIVLISGHWCCVSLSFYRKGFMPHGAQCKTQINQFRKESNLCTRHQKWTRWKDEAVHWSYMVFPQKSTQRVARPRPKWPKSMSLRLYIRVFHENNFFLTVQVVETMTMKMRHRSTWWIPPTQQQTGRESPVIYRNLSKTKRKHGTQRLNS